MAPCRRIVGLRGRGAAGFDVGRGTEAEADLLPGISFFGFYPENKKKPGEA